MIGRNLLTTLALATLFTCTVLSLTACGGGGNSSVLGPPPVADVTAIPSAGLVQIAWGAQSGLNLWGDAGAVEPSAQVELSNGNNGTSYTTSAPDGSFTFSIDLQAFGVAEGDTFYVRAQAANKDYSDPIQVIIPVM